VPLDPDGPRCSCGSKGCWEVLASSTAALRYYFESRTQNSRAGTGRLTFQDLLRLAEQGDVLAGRALNRMAAQLGRGARMIVGGLAPEAIIFIGELTAAWERFRPIIDAEIQAQTLSAAPTLLLTGRDGATARVRGTMVLVLQKHFGAPLSAVSSEHQIAQLG
jgi:predicted NBD/HSP70 family sugar kinase